MEKYSDFADSKTGKHPFIPPWSNSHRPLCLRILLSLLVPIALLRVLCSIVLLALYAILAIGLVPFEILGLHFASRYVVKCFAFALMAVTGFYRVKEVSADPRRLKIQPQHIPPDALPPFEAQLNGSLTFSNFTSFAEILYLGLTLQPVFAVPHKDQSLSLLCWQKALWYALFSSTLLEGCGEFETLQEVHTFTASRRLGPIVVLPEGMKSNGTCILKWLLKSAKDSEVNNLLRNCTCMVVFSYEGTETSYGPQHTIGRPLWHLYNLCRILYSNMTVTWASQQQVEKLFDNAPKSSDSIEHLRAGMQRLLPNSCLVDVDGSKLSQFVEVYSTTQRRKYV